MRFTNEVVDEALYADFRLMNGLNEEQLEEFLGLVLRFLAGQTAAEFMEAVAAFAAAHSASPNALKNPLRGALLFFKGALKSNLTPAYVKEDLIELGLAEDKAEKAEQLWKRHYLDLSRAASEQTLMVNELVDMDWRFGVTSSTSEMFRVGSTFLQLKLVLNKGVTKENVSMELSLPQFYQFLHEMEKAKASLDFFS